MLYKDKPCSLYLQNTVQRIFIPNPLYVCISTLSAITPCNYRIKTKNIANGQCARKLPKEIHPRIKCMQTNHTSLRMPTRPIGRKRPGGESRLPAAIVPPPGLGKIICMRKICKKFDARVNAGVFFCKTLP